MVRRTDRRDRPVRRLVARRTALVVGDMSGTVTECLAADAPNWARVWRQYKGEHTSGITCLAWSHDGERIAYATGDAIRVLNTADRREVALNAADRQEVAFVAPPDQFYLLCAFAPDDRSLFVAGRRAGDVWVWDFATNRESRSLTSHPVAVGGLVLGNAGKLLVTAANDALV